MSIRTGREASERKKNQLYVVSLQPVAFFYCFCQIKPGQFSQFFSWHFIILFFFAGIWHAHSCEVFAGPRGT